MHYISRSRCSKKFLKVRTTVAPWPVGRPPDAESCVVRPRQARAEPRYHTPRHLIKHALNATPPHLNTRCIPSP